MDTITYSRQPTKSEIKFGHGAMHHADFTREECWDKKKNRPKKWLKSPYDGLRYYRYL